jgi:integrase
MPTFSQQVDVYLERLSTKKRRPVKPASIATRRSILRAAVPVLGETELADIRSGALRTLANALSDRGYKPGSIETVVTAAKTVVESDTDENGEPKHLHKWNNVFIFENVAAIPKRAKLEVTATDIEAAILQLESPLREFVATQAASGMRKGELLALRVEDFDADTGLLRVSRTLGQYGETDTKTQAGDREIDIAPEIVVMLVEMLAGRTSGRLFDVTLKQVRGAFEKLGIKSHSLRKFRYTRLDKLKVHPAIHAFWIGHSMGSLKKIYGFVHEDIELRQRLVREVGLGFTLPVSTRELVRA